MGRFERTTPAPIIAGTKYDRFQDAVRADFEQCCAYCYLHEDHLGGQRHFELDHFCPRKHCPERADDFFNLYWSCHGCNKPGNKHAHWPSSELLALGYGFVDLCIDRFEDHYSLLPSGTLIPLTKKAEYTIKHVNLNHVDLISIRRRLYESNVQMDVGYTSAPRVRNAGEHAPPTC